MMFRKGNALADEVDAVITELKQEGFIARLHKHWYGTVPAENSSTVMVTEKPASH